MHNKNIIIIGAGFAGLTAAKLLHESGYSVRILEAKNRIGGRTQTVQLGTAKIDTGASWIHYKNGNPLTYIAAAHGLEVIDDEYEPFEIWDEQLGTFLGSEKGEYMEAAELAREAAIDYFLVHRGEDTTADFIKSYLKNKNWSPTKKRIVRTIYALFLETDYATAIENISLSDERVLNRFDNDDENDGLIIGGYEMLLNIISQGLDIQLSTIVHHINYQDNQVIISTNQGEYTADKVIVTVSLGVLKNGLIRFQPPLPEAKQKAIQSLGFGNLEKVILTFEEVFWKDTKHTMFFSATEKNGMGFSSIVDFSNTTGQPTLIMFYMSEFAEQMQAKDDAAILAAALEVLKKIFREAYIPPSQTYLSRWSTDPMFGGSYSYSNDDNNEAVVTALAEPVGDSLFFAGEATSLEGQAYVHGGLLSGMREAQRLGASIEHIKGLDVYLNSNDINLLVFNPSSK